MPKSLGCGYSPSLHLFQRSKASTTIPIKQLFPYASAAKKWQAFLNKNSAPTREQILKFRGPGCAILGEGGWSFGLILQDVEVQWYAE